jgi:hypothetical protein
MTDHLTDPVSVQVHRAGTLPKPGEWRRIWRACSRWPSCLMRKFEIAGIKFGWDAIVGLVPVAGDIVTSLIGIYPLLHRAEAQPRKVHPRRGWSATADRPRATAQFRSSATSFDVGFKAHMKNAKLLERAAAKAKGKSADVIG